MIIIGMIGYILILSSVTSIIGQFNLKNQKRLAELDSINAYLKTAHVSKALKRDIRTFYDFLWIEKGVGSEDGSAFIGQLPMSLQVRLVSEIHRKILSRIHIFKNMSPDATHYLVNVWEREIFMPDDIIIDEGSFSSTLFIILRGKVQLFIQSGFFRVSMMELDEGAFFGESGIVSKKPVEQVASVMSLGYTEMLCLSKDTYDEMRRKFPANSLAHEQLTLSMSSVRARAKWKKAFMKVKAVNRLMRMATLNRPGNKRPPRRSSQYGRRGSVQDFAGRMKSRITMARTASTRMFDTSPSKGSTSQKVPA